MKHSDYQAIVSHLQIEADETAYRYVKLQKEANMLTKINILNEFVDFNAHVLLKYTVPLLVREDAINFFLNHSSEIKRQFNIGEFLFFSKMFNLVSVFKTEITSFKHLKDTYTKILKDSEQLIANKSILRHK